MAEVENQEEVTVEEEVLPISKSKENSENEKQQSNSMTPNYDEMEDVMTKGMEFLTGLYQMSSGQKLTKKSKPKVKIDKESGEISISFKMEALISEKDTL